MRIAHISFLRNKCELKLAEHACYSIDVFPGRPEMADCITTVIKAIVAQSSFQESSTYKNPWINTPQVFPIWSQKKTLISPSSRQLGIQKKPDLNNGVLIFDSFEEVRIRELGLR
jgi:hypothetical protein